MARTVTETIKALGGSDTVAAALGITPSAIELWKHRKTIPRGRWPDLVEHFPGQVTTEALRATEVMQAPEREDRRAKRRQKMQDAA